jgi:hypothetical protein
MMHRPDFLKGSVAALAAALVAVSVGAEPMRTFLVKENKLPDKGQLETGGYFMYREYKAYDDYYEVPYLRYGALDKLALTAELPIRQHQPNVGESHWGLGDVGFGAELRAYEDIFRYPWIIPYADISFPSGNENKGLGAGQTVTTFGMAVGTQVEDLFYMGNILHFIVDGAYTIGSKDRNYKDNVASLGGGIIWDISPEFALMGEVRATNQEAKDEYADDSGDNPVYYMGGASYKATEQLVFSVHGGAVNTGAEDMNIIAKASYTFW